MSSCPTEYALLEYLAENQDLELAEHLETCAPCAQRFIALTAERKVFLAAHPLPALDDLHGRETQEDPKVLWLPPRPRLGNFSSRPVQAVAAMVLVLLVGTGLLMHQGWISPQDHIRFKGSSQDFGYYLKRGEVYRLPETSPLVAGDQILLYYRTPRTYVLVLGIEEESGKVNAYHATPAGKSLRANQDGLTIFDQKIVLDQAKGRELFVALFSDHPLDFADLRTDLEARQDLPLDHVLPQLPEVETSTFVISKR